MEKGLKEVRTQTGSHLRVTVVRTQELLSFFIKTVLGLSFSWRHPYNVVLLRTFCRHLLTLLTITIIIISSVI